MGSWAMTSRNLVKLDLILWAPDKATLVTFGKNNNLIDAENNVFPWVSYCWWAGTGKLMTQAGTYDQDGNQLTPPTYLSGEVMLLRLFTEKFGGGSAVKTYIENNGTPGVIAGINYYEIDSVRLFRARDVLTYLANNNLPGHFWAGGNSFSN